MEAWQQRTAMVLGEQALTRLSASRVAVVGVGGVGGWAAEMLARSGIGHILIIDSDDVSDTNRNRQLAALSSTVGRKKVEVLAERLLDINPGLNLETIDTYLEADAVDGVLGTWRPDFVVDAIDTIAPKMALIRWCLANRVPSVSSMGAGARLDATKVRIADISGTFNCNLAAVIRKRLRKEGIEKGVRVVFSEELPDREAIVPCTERNKCSLVGSIPYIPAVFGCCCAQEAVRVLAGK